MEEFFSLIKTQDLVKKKALAGSFLSPLTQFFFQQCLLCACRNVFFFVWKLSNPSPQPLIILVRPFGITLSTSRNFRRLCDEPLSGINGVYQPAVDLRVREVILQKKAIL